MHTHIALWIRIYAIIESNALPHHNPHPPDHPPNSFRIEENKENDYLSKCKEERGRRKEEEDFGDV